MADVAHAAARGKPPSKNYKSPSPGWARVEPSVDTSAASRAVYDGQTRIGAYHRVLDRWLAVDRLGRSLGQFDSELEAQDAISKAVRL